MAWVTTYMLQQSVLREVARNTEDAKKMYTHFKKGKNCIKIVILNIYSYLKLYKKCTYTDQSNTTYLFVQGVS
jgi:hypothetical protein